MKKIACSFIIAALITQIFCPGWAADPTPVEDAAARQQWGSVLSGLGVHEGKELPTDQYVSLLRKLAAFPPVAVKIRQASTKTISILEWAQILRGLGITPKPQMKDFEWAAILSHAGVDVSKGVSPSLSQMPVPAVPPTPFVKVSSAAPPVIVLSPAVVAVSTPAVTVSTATPSATVVALSSPVTPAYGVAVASAPIPIAVPPAAALSSLPPASIASTPTLAVTASSATVPAAPIIPLISLELRGMDINEVLKTIARQGSLNVVTSANVHGSVSISLKNVDLWMALRVILEANDLAYSYDGVILRVMTAADYEKLYGTRFDDKTVIKTIALKNVKASAMGKYLDSLKTKIGKILIYDYNNTLILVDTPDSIKRMEELAQHLDAELSTKVYALNYAKVDELLPKIQALVTKDIGDVEIDKRTNRMIVMDFPDHFGAIDAIVNAFDHRHRAVLIEAKILQITLNESHQLGVNWQYVFSSVGRHASIGGTANSAFTFLPAPVAAGTQVFSATFGGKLADNDYSAILQALETVGKTNLLSSPRVNVINNETANILVGTREAYVTTTVTTPGGGSPATTAEQINFVDVGVKLHVTPTIGEDNYITIKIKPEVSSVDHTLTTSQGNVVPIVRTSQEESTVIVKNGETLVMAGLIEDNVTVNRIGIPFLSRIPLLGALFRSDSKQVTKTDITVLLTPRILPDEFLDAALDQPKEQGTHY